MNGLYQVIEKNVIGLKREYKSRISTFAHWLITFILINYSWVFFRADTINEAILATRKILHLPIELFQLVSGSVSLSSLISLSGTFIWNFGMCFIGIATLLAISLYEESSGGSIITFVSERKHRRIIYFLILFVTLCFGKFGSDSQFIYFRF